MEKIASFTVDHLLLEPGVYVSRVDSWQGIDVTTLDLRMVAPNREPPMDTAAVHAIEHLGATFLRNNASWKERIVYFGPIPRALRSRDARGGPPLDRAPL